jgi:GT2 family glycosyltransferase
MFLDDDFHMHSEYLRFTEEHFSRHPCTMATTGSLLMDGINGPGLTADEAVTALSIAQLTSVPSAHRVFNAYGCNMCFRFDIIRSRELYFDESLPLYGWYEDVDFCRRMAPYGAIVRLSHAIGVHLGVKGGRQSGRRLGYSQVANPIYLMCKRSVPWYFAITSLATRFMKNLVLTCAPEPHIDRLGRLKGNLIAIRDLSGGKLHPLRATDV